MSLSCGVARRTFVLSIRNNDSDRETASQILTIGTETFHEIIYGKSERGANERRVFFVPTQMAPLRGFFTP